MPAKHAAQTSKAQPLPHPRVLVDMFGYVVNRVADGVREEVEGSLAKHDINAKHFGALMWLAAEGPMSQQAMAKQVRIDRTTMVSIIDHLEKKGLVRRDRNPQDRRAHAVNITDRGREVLGRAMGAVQRCQEKWLAPLDGEERRTLMELLKKLLP